MKKINKEFDKKIVISSIMIVVFVVIVLVSVSMRSSSYVESWLVCDYPDSYNNYSETLKFRYVEGTLYGYYRYEKFTTTDEDSKQEEITYFQTEVDKVSSNLNDNFIYKVNEVDDGVEINTYIGVSVYPTFFNSYLSSKNITANDDINTIKSNLEGSSYTCTITRK
ncbi:MAG TPA: hypothetical protein PKG93_00970 [Bacilli bacterium]|nr:hypothetical protein [Bacilli bacterium]HPZ23720.1 hypothetical protein [Bacilli bacterium]